LSSSLFCILFAPIKDKYDYIKISDQDNKSDTLLHLHAIVLWNETHMHDQEIKKKKLCEAELDDLAAISKESKKSNMAAHCMPSLLRC